MLLLGLHLLPTRRAILFLLFYFRTRGWVRNFQHGHVSHFPAKESGVTTPGPVRTLWIKLNMVSLLVCDN